MGTASEQELAQARPVLPGPEPRVVAGGNPGTPPSGPTYVAQANARCGCTGRSIAGDLTSP